MSDETMGDEVPDWIQALVEQIEPRLVYHSVGQPDLRWTDTGLIAVSLAGRSGERNVRLQIQFEPFEDAEPTFIVDLRGDEDDQPDSENGNGQTG